MNNKTKLIIVIAALAVVLVGCIVAALFVGGAFDKPAGGSDPIVDVDPTGNQDPVVDPESSSDPTDPEQTADPTTPSASTTPTDPTSSTKPSSGGSSGGNSKPADKDKNDIEIGIDDEEDPSTPTSPTEPTKPSGGANVSTDGSISFDDLIAASGGLN